MPSLALPVPASAAACALRLVAGAAAAGCKGLAGGGMKSGSRPGGAAGEGVGLCFHRREATGPSAPRLLQKEIKKKRLLASSFARQSHRLSLALAVESHFRFNLRTRTEHHLKLGVTSPSSSAAVCNHAIFTCCRPTGFGKHWCCVTSGLASSESLCSVRVVLLAVVCVLHAINIIPFLLSHLPYLVWLKLIPKNASLRKAACTIY